MAYFKLTCDVMIHGDTHLDGEVVDISEAEGQLLVGLQRAEVAKAPAPVGFEEPKPAPAAPKQRGGRASAKAEEEE